jgi:hypothetical protein
MSGKDTADRVPVATLRADVVDLLINQHMQIRELFVEVEAATGDRRAELFRQLVTLLAVHETAEEQVVHPLARGAMDGGDAVVDERLAEERVAKEQLSAMEDLDPASTEFATALTNLRTAVLAHAHSEEAYEFRYLRRTVDPQRLQALATMVRAAEAMAPTHPHPGVESAKANMTIGPIAAVFDRAKDLLSKAMPNGR